MEHETEVLVIGGGAVGICSAYYLRRQGRHVTVIEKNEICSGSSYGNAGLIVPSHSVPLAAPGMILKGIKWMFNPASPFYIKPRFDGELLAWLWRFRRACAVGCMHKAIPVIRDLSFASLQLWDQLAAMESLDFGYTQNGMLAVFKTPKGLEEGVAEARLMQSYGVDARVIEPAEIQALEQGLQTAALGGVYYPQDAHLDPQRFVSALARYIEKEGVNIHRSTEALGFETAGRKVTIVQTTRGAIAAANIVLATGAWSSVIARDLKIKLLLQPAKGYSVTFKRPSNCPVIPLGMAEARVVVTPMGDSMRLAGTLELAGLDLTINRRRVQAILDSVPDYLPDMDPRALDLIEIWRGLRPCTPDGLPLLGRSRNYDNLIVAAGHGMLGISLSPITGKLVSQLVANDTTAIDLTPFRPERFA
ncbi:MAG: FAD-dependent oxidoreductase [Desulfobacterales bacterium]|nr:MAG: FAD-dependent oxidoreductase [Desulfobacterales bacterium]